LHGVVFDILVGSESRVGPCGCVAAPIAGLIESMKHLTTDVGCVGFLTDCRSYDRLMEEVSARPVAHSWCRIPTAGMAQVMTFQL